MPKALTLEQFARLILWFLLAAALLAIGPRIADWMLARPDPTVMQRWLAVAIAVCSLIPWLLFVAWGIAIADEFQRQILLVGTALGFVAALLVSVATAVMADADLIAYPPRILDVRTAFGFWFLGLAISWLHHRARG
jgi:hypothetical protein